MHRGEGLRERLRRRKNGGEEGIDAAVQLPGSGRQGFKRPYHNLKKSGRLENWKKGGERGGWKVWPPRRAKDGSKKN